MLYFLAYLNYLHLNLHDESETKVGTEFYQIFEFIKEATLPEVHDCSLHEPGMHTEFCGGGAMADNGQGDSGSDAAKFAEAKRRSFLGMTPDGQRELPVSN